MSASSFVLTLVALVLGQPGTPTGSLPPFEYVNERAVNVPLRLDPARQAEIKEILLFISQDEGANWNLTTKARPEQKDITFSVTNDGIYWLRLATIDRFGKQTPENPKTVPPNARFVIDTLKPYLKLTNVQRSGNDIVAAWQVSEDNPSWESFRLEYLAAGSGFPVAVPNATPGMSGQVRFTPNTNGPVTVRLTLRDKAGNESMTSTDVAGIDGTVATASPHRRRSAAAAAADTTPVPPVATLPPTLFNPPPQEQVSALVDPRCSDGQPAVRTRAAAARSATPRDSEREHHGSLEPAGDELGPRGTDAAADREHEFPAAAERRRPGPGAGADGHAEHVAAAAAAAGQFRQQPVRDARI